MMQGFNTTRYNGVFPPDAPIVPIPALISGKKVFVFADESMQYAIVVGLDDDFICYRSSTHFVDTQWLEGTNKFSIAPVIDATQVTGYAKYGYLYAVGFKSGIPTEYKSEDFGKTWTQMVIS